MGKGSKQIKEVRKDYFFMPIIDIYYEHIEEAAFLYDQRENIFSDPEGDLEYQHQIEERLEAHVDALELGGEHSRPIIAKYLDSDDDGEFFTALFSLLRITKENPNEYLDFLENNPFPSLRSATQVLRLFENSFSNQRLASWLEADSSTYRCLAASLVGYQRNVSLLSPLEALLNDSDASVNTAALNALNRLDPEKGKQCAYTALLDGKGDESLLAACFENLYLQKEATTLQKIAVQYCTGKYLFHPTAPILLSLSEREEDVTVLKGMINESPMNRSVAQAIGLTGRIDLLQELVPLEGNPECNGFLQEASHLILGTLPPVFDEDDDDQEEPTKLFVLSEAIASFCQSGKEQAVPYRLGMPKGDAKNRIEILKNIGSPYRKWLYLEIFSETGKIEMDHDSTAKVQYHFINNLV